MPLPPASCQPFVAAWSPPCLLPVWVSLLNYSGGMGQALAGRAGGAFSWTASHPSDALTQLWLQLGASVLLMEPQSQPPP